MVNDYYKFEELPEGNVYLFESEGVRGKVLKYVEIFEQQNSIWNLGFADIQEDGKINDTVVTNNLDFVKVLSTVAQIAYQFFETHPDAVIQIIPVDIRRKRLYNALFQRHFETLVSKFDLFGFKDNQKWLYLSENAYDSFQIKLKSAK